MRILLPPSEGKTAGGRGRPLRHRAADDSPLAAARGRALDALGELLADPGAATDALLLPRGVAEEALRVNAAVLDSRTTPALRRYAGVVYDGLGYAGLSPAEQRIADRSCLIFSGLFGVLRGDEPVPNYRVPAKATLPGLGIAGTFWRPVLDQVLATRLGGDGPVIDLRSSDYAAMWRPGRGLGERVFAVRVLSPAPSGGHAVISYNSKLAKGRLAAELIRRQASGRPVRSVDDVAAAWLVHADAADAELAKGRLDLYTR